MKKILAPVLPALALLTLGGCASTSYLSTTEDDGMYYSSRDRVTAPAQVATTSSAAPASEEGPAAPGDVANPDYAGSAGRTATTSGEYYDDDYYYASRLRRFHSPYRGIGMGYYDFAYTDPFWYGGSALGYSPWGYGYGYNSFYDPFYSPWSYGGVNISIGFGRPWGWGRPWGYGYGYSPFDYGWGGPWGGYNYGYYNGYYSGLYGGGYYGGGYGGNGWGNYYDRPGRRVTYGPRADRATDGQRFGNASPDGVVSGRSRGRVQEGGFTSPTPAPSGIVGQPGGGGRRRVQELPETTTQPMPTDGRRRIAQDVPTTQPDQISTATSPAPDGGGRRWRVLDNTNNVNVVNPDGSTSQPAPADYGRRRRADWSNGNSTQPQVQPEQPRLADQPRRQRMYDQSAQPSQPSQPSRTYSEPSRSYSQPSRSYEPSRSYSEPSRGSSNSGGSFGGGNSGGGGGGGGRRGRVQ